MGILLCRISISLLGHKPVRRVTNDLLLLAAFISAGQKAVNTSYFDRGLILSVKHRHKWMNWFKSWATKNKVASKAILLRPNTVYTAVIDFILTYSFVAWIYYSCKIS